MKRLFEKYPVQSVLVLMLICFSPLMALRDFTPANELRYLSIADEAIREGHLFAFTNHGLAYADKPPLYLWLFMLSRLIFGGHVVYVLSLFSFIPMAVIVLTMDKWVFGGTGEKPRKRAASALMLGTSLLFTGISMFLRMDMLMTMFIVLALYSWHKDRPWLFALFTFLALFTKGPVGLLVPPVAVVTYYLSTRQKGLGRWLGWRFWLLLAGLCAVWFTGAWLDGGKEYLSNLLFHQTLDRAVNSFNHSEPFYFYLTGIWEVLFPWSLLAVPVLIMSLVRRKGSSGTEKMFRCTVLSAFVMLSCFSSKINLYLAPVIPFIIYLLPLTVGRLGWRRWMSWAVAVPAALTGIFGLILSLAVPLPLIDRIPSMSAYLQFFHSPWMAAVGLVLLAGAIWTAAGAFRERSLTCSIPLACGIVAAVLFFSPIVPGLNDFIGYAALCKDIPAGETVYGRRVQRCENMDVFLGHEIVKLSDDDPAPEDGVFVSKANSEDPVLIGRRKIVHGQNAVWLPSGWE